MQGTPYIYQGEEIGMTNVAFDSIEAYRDIETINYYHEMVDEKGADAQAILQTLHAKSRDNARTPMQWSNGPQAGFTTGKPWIKVNPNYTQINAAQALSDPDSIFYYYQKLIRLRKEYPLMVYGRYDLLLEDDEQIYAYTRTLDAERLLVILNFSNKPAVFALPGSLGHSNTELLISNYAVEPDQLINSLVLRPYEARVYRLV